MVVGSYYENKARSRRDYEEKLSEHSETLRRVIVTLDAAREEEIASRYREFPSASETSEFVDRLSPRLWERHSDEEEFLTLRVGRAEQDSRTKVVVDSGGSRKLRDELEEIPPRLFPDPRPSRGSQPPRGRRYRDCWTYRPGQRRDQGPDGATSGPAFPQRRCRHGVAG